MPGPEGLAAFSSLHFRHRLISHGASAIRAGLGVMRLAEVRLQEGESLENALRRFKRKVQTEEIIKEVKRHSYYLKPGEKRRSKLWRESAPEKRFAESRIKLRQFGPLLPSGGLSFSPDEVLRWAIRRKLSF